jgi:hypothetical protein
MERQSMRRINVILSLILVFLFAIELVASAVNCSVCGKRISGRYLKAGGKVFCSKRCYAKTQPECAMCGKRCSKGYFQKGGKYYCSRQCVNKTLPICANCGKRFQQGAIIKGPFGTKVFCPACAKGPKCFACSFPGDCRQLQDGRYICRSCASTAVFDHGMAEKVFQTVRARLKKDLNIGTDHKVYFSLVDAKTLEKNSANYAPGQELGLFRNQYTLKTETKVSYSLLNGRSEKARQYKTDVRNSIMVLYGLPKKKLIEVCAHELAHDWMQEYYPGIKELKVKEGWAEYVAARANILFGQKVLNKRMEQNTDKIYGDGYRMIKKYSQTHGFDGLKIYFRKISR